MINLFCFALGGYLIPAAYFAYQMYKSDQKSLDNPTKRESAVSAALFGFSWPWAEWTAED